MSSILPHHHTESITTDNLCQQLNQVQDFQATANVFKQVGDPTRLKIFWLLCHCEECVTDIAAMIEMSSPAVSHHLRPLKTCGLITGRREGKEVYYKAATTTEAQTLHHMIETIMDLTCP